MKIKIDNIALLLMTGALGGCPMASTLYSADPVAPGSWELAASVDGVFLRDQPQETRALGAQASAAARLGVAEDLDVGLRLYTFGVDASARWRVSRGVWRVAALPSFGVVRTQESATTTDALHFFGQLPWIWTRDMTPSIQLNTGPALQWGLYWPKTGGTAQGVMLGGFANLAFALSDGVRLVPELGLRQTVWGEVPVDGTWAHLALGITWRL